MGSFAYIIRSRFDIGMGTKSRETIYGSSVRASAERAKEARKVADRLACEAWTQRMLGFQGPAQPSPALGEAPKCRVPLSRSQMPRLPNPPSGRAGHHPQTEGDTDPRIRTLHALQRLLSGASVSLQAQPSRCVADNQDHRQRSAVGLMAGGTIGGTA